MHRLVQDLASNVKKLLELSIKKLQALVVEFTHLLVEWLAVCTKYHRCVNKCSVRASDS